MSSPVEWRFVPESDRSQRSSQGRLDAEAVDPLSEDAVEDPIDPYRLSLSRSYSKGKSDFGSRSVPRHSMSQSGTPTARHRFYHELQLNGLPEQVMSSQEIEEALYARYENLQEMRPYHLIGKSEPLVKWEELRKSDDVVLAITNRKVRQFYLAQNDLIDKYIEVDRLLDSGMPQSMLRVYGDDLYGTNSIARRQGTPANIDSESNPLLGPSQDEQSKIIMFAIYVNFAVNFFLLIGKIVVAVLTSSLTILASLVDSILDFLSTVIIWASTRLVGQRDWQSRHMYPVGRSRLEPIGVLVFSVLIILSFLQIGREAIQKLIEMTGEVVTLDLASIIIMFLTIVVKIGCWLWCRTINSSAVQALAQDAMTDIVFNTFSLLFPLAGHFFDEWWIDPLGALVLSLYIIFSWGGTALEHINNLTGSAADPEDRQVVLYLASRFAESIKQITFLNAYHTGDRLLVEVDIVLDGSLNLKDSHDIGEALQYAIETLTFVERAFVHLDYRTGNFTGHIDR